MKLNDKVGMRIAKSTAKFAGCESRQIGAAILFGERIVSMGCNGAVTMPPCGECQRASSNSGDDLHLCQAIHAEVNAIAAAARFGVSTKGATMYMTCGVPCKDCLNAITAAGIIRIVCRDSDEYYDELSREMAKVSSIIIDTYVPK